jgi:hypothetical protein
LNTASGNRSQSKKVLESGPAGQNQNWNACENYSHTIAQINVKTLLPISLAVMMTFIGAFAGRGATRISTAAGGNWNSGATWTSGTPPTGGDIVFIMAGASVTVTSPATVTSLVFSNNSASTATLTVNSGVTLTVTAGITNQNSATTNTAVLIQGAGTVTCASFSVGGTTTPTPLNSAFTATLTSSISNLSVSGNLTIKALYNSPQSAANQGTFALSSGAVGVGGSVSFVTVPIFGPTLTLATGSQDGTLTLSGATPFTFTGGGSSTFTPNGASATVNYSGAAQTVLGATYQNVILSGSGSKTTAGITVNGTLSMQGTATATAVPVYGASSTLEYKGSAAQTTGPELAVGLGSLTINNTNGVTAATSTTVTNTLTFAAGKLITGASQINLATNGSVSGASAASYVNGNLRKAFTVGTQAFTFPIGDSSSYAPLVLSNLSVTSAGSLSASTTSGSHPQFGSSGLDANRNVNRYWTLTQSGGTFGTYGATFNYPATEVDTNTVPSAFSAVRWNGGAWSGSTVSGTPTTNSTAISAQSGFGDFAIGNSTPWYNGAWRYRLAITINHTNVAANLTNFPVLINLTNSALQQFAKTNGNDILFTSNDGTTKLAHEIESYINSNGALVAWVNVPLLSATTDTLLYLYYGNAAASSQQNVPGTWDSSFKGVWHLNTVFTDSTSNSFNGTNTGTINAVGRISNGRSFVRADGDDYITVTGLMGSPASITLSAWVNLFSTDTKGAEIISLGDHASLRHDRNTGLLGFFYDGNTWHNTISATNVVGTGWRYVAYTVDAVAKTQSVYVDGVQSASTAFTNSLSFAGLAPNTIIGKHGNGQTAYTFDGTMDEVRVAQTSRSAAWLSTEFNNQRAPGTFQSVGIPEMAVPTKLAVTSVNGGSSPTVGTPFNVVIQALDDGGNPQNVRSNTAVSLSLNTGTGALGGTLAGTILAGTDSVTISGITYTKAESGVSLTVTRTSGDNLTASNSAPFTVLPANQTIAFPSPGNQTYGVGPIALGATASSGLTVSYSVISGPATVSNNVVTITGSSSVTIQASQSGNSNWNAAPTTNQTISVAQKTINGSITASNKVYDATTTGGIATRTLSGVTNSDVVTLTGGVATFTNKNVGNGKTVTAIGLSLIGANATNYTLASTSATTTADIATATLTVSASGVNKIYDGTTNATVTLSDNRLAGDVLTTGYTAASFADKNVGSNKTVNVSGISVTGADSGNYAFNTTAAATANITAALLTVTASNTNRPYGTPNPSFTASCSGFVSGEGTNVLSGSPALSTTATTNTPVGNYPIQVDQGTLSSINYTFSLNNGTLTVFEVPVALTLNYVAGQTNHVDLRCTGLTPGNTYHLQASTDLAQWIEISTTQAALDGTILFTDSDVAVYPVRFYRLSNQ